MLDGGLGRGTGATVVAGDENDVGVRLGDTSGDRAHAHLGNQLDTDAGVAVAVLQIVNQLGEIFDRVDVVVRRRRNESDARSGVTGLGDPRVNLRAGQLTAFT